MTLSHTYTVTKEQYGRILVRELKAGRNEPLRLILFFLSTLGQMGLAGYLIATVPAPLWQKLLMAAASLGITTLSCLRRYDLPRRASQLLQRFCADGTIPEDFWQAHTLQCNDETLTLAYGKETAELPLCTIARSIQADGLLYLYQGRKIIDAIPADSFPDESSGAAFADSLEQMRQAAAEAHYTAELAMAPEDAAFLLKWEQTPEQAAENQALGAKYAYTTKLRWRILDLMTFVATLYMILRTIEAFSWASLVLTILVCACLNYRRIRELTPLQQRLLTRMATEYPAAFLHGKVVCYLESNTITVFDGSRRIALPTSQVAELRKPADVLLLYTQKEFALAIPSRAFSSEEQAGRFMAACKPAK